MKRTFLGTGVLIALVRGKSRERETALQLVTEPNRVFLASPFLELEFLPHARRLKKLDQVALLEGYFRRTERTTDLDGLLETANDVLLATSTTPRSCPALNTACR